MATTATSPEWARVVNTTIHEYLRTEEPAVLRRRLLFYWLKKRGRVQYNKSGDQVQWPVRYRRAKMQINSGMQALQFTAENRWLPAVLSYAGYAVTDAMPKREFLMNRSTEAIVKVFSRLVPLLQEDIENAFCEELYIDSAASGNTGRYSGIETMMETTGTVNIGTGAQRSTANALDAVGWPTSTYAGLSTQLGFYGGAWGAGTAQTTISTTWPNSRGDNEYDFWSPAIVNFTSSAFGNTTWSGNAKTATRFMIHRIKKNTKSTIQMVLMDDELYRQYKENLDSKERVIQEVSEEEKKLGFYDSFYQDGARITSEYGIPPNVGYGFNLDDMELLSMQEGIFMPDGPEWDMLTRAWRVAVDNIGQLRFASPRNFGKLVSLA